MKHHFKQGTRVEIVNGSDLDGYYGEVLGTASFELDGIKHVRPAHIAVAVDRRGVMVFDVDDIEEVSTHAHR